MSLDVYLSKLEPTNVFSANITHNLNKMADEAGIYHALWHPEEIGITKANDLIEPLKSGLERMKSNPDIFKRFSDPNGRGTYDQFVPWVEKYLEACKENPDAEISVSR